MLSPCCKTAFCWANILSMLRLTFSATALFLGSNSSMSVVMKSRSFLKGCRGCLSTFFSSSSIHWRTASRNATVPSGRFSQNPSSKKPSDVRLEVLLCLKFSSEAKPIIAQIKTSRNTQPRDHTSYGREVSPFVSISGGSYVSVPLGVFVGWLRERTIRILLEPKSAICKTLWLRFKYSNKRMFSGFKSWCQPAFCSFSCCTGLGLRFESELTKVRS